MGQRRSLTSPQTWQSHNLDFLGRLQIPILWSVILRLACRAVRWLVLFGGGAWKYAPSCTTYRTSKQRGSWLPGQVLLAGPFPGSSQQTWFLAVTPSLSFQVYFCPELQIPHHKSPFFFPKDPISFHKRGFSLPTPGTSESQPASLPVGHKPTFLTNQQPCFCLREKSLVWSSELQPEDTCGQSLERGPKTTSPRQKQRCEVISSDFCGSRHTPGRACALPGVTKKSHSLDTAKSSVSALEKSGGLNGHFLCWVFIHVSWSLRLYK